MTVPGGLDVWPGAGRSSKRFVPITVCHGGCHGGGHWPQGAAGHDVWQPWEPLPGITITGAAEGDTQQTPPRRGGCKAGWAKPRDRILLSSPR